MQLLYSLQNHISVNQTKIKIILLVFSIFCLISPFTGLLELHSNLILYFKSNFSNISQFPTNISPIFLLLQFLMYELNSLVEFIFPKLWGPNNYFFMRFIFKLPLFIIYIVIAFLVEKIIFIELENRQLASRAFYIQLFNIPIMYTTFILGTPECLAIFFILIQYYFLLQWKANGTLNNNWYLGFFLTGFIFGIALSFSFSILLIIFVFFSFMKLKQAIVYVLSMIFSFLLVSIPIYLSVFQHIDIHYQSFFGIQNVLIFLKIDYMQTSIFIFIIEVAILAILTKQKISSSLDNLLIASCIIIVLTVNLTFYDFILLLQLFILGMVKYSDFDTTLRFHSYVFEKFPNIQFYFPLLLLYSFCFFYVSFFFRISDVIYLKFIELGPIGSINRSFWNLGIILEFNIAFYFSYSFLLFFTSLILIKKRKIFNTSEIQ